MLRWLRAIRSEAQGCEVTAPREKPAPLTWRPIDYGGKPGSLASLGRHVAVVWLVGGQYSHRSIVHLSGAPSRDSGRIVSHFGESGAKTSAEKRLRKVAAA